VITGGGRVLGLLERLPQIIACGPREAHHEMTDVVEPELGLEPRAGHRRHEHRLRERLLHGR
jgi:hypothetical protein